MKNKLSLLLLVLMMFQLGCSPEQKIDAYNLNPILEAKAQMAKASELKIKLELCNVIPFKWDKIMIVPPYTTAGMIRSHKLNNSRFIEKNMIDSLYDENKCLFLFIQQNTIVRYGFVDRTPLDFNYINEADKIKTISRKIACDELYIINVNNKLKLKY